MGKKLKLILIIGIPVLVIALSVCGGYWFGYGSGKDVGHNEGFISGNTTGYEKGYVSGYDNGKEFVVTHLDQYVTVPKNVSYKEVVAFLTNDQTDKVEYSAKDFDCTSFSNMVRNNAIEKGIKCGLVSFDLVSPQKIVGHVILIFETTDKGIVYFDPQTDGQRYDIRVGGTYTLSGVVYKITKVDLIW
jgi:hypothetical protein